MSSASSSIPTGTVTLLMTDVEGSTRGWEAQPDVMKTAMVRQLELLATVIADHGGFRPEEQGEGDSVVAAFERASDAVAAALDAQRRLIGELGDVFRVRIAVHTDEVFVRNERNYAGPAMNRAARLRACGHGGQVLVSGATADLVGDRLPDGAWLVPLGRHRLRDLNRPEEVWQLAAPDLPSQFGPLQSLDAFPTNLPVGLTPLIGRVDELEELRTLLTDVTTRLLTLTGPGGVGKTRLALQLAGDNLEAFGEGLWWAELAPVSDDDRVAATIASAMKLPEAPGVSSLSQVEASLGAKRALVVMDNCEHLVDTSALVAEAILRACPAVTVLATSREPLGASGERLWRVPSLSLPSESEGESLDALARSDAGRLFLDRARQARPHFNLSTDNLAPVSEICRRLDGIPLALELAAARIRTSPVERVAAQLHERFLLLTGGARTALPRQQTLLASVDWSHDLLSDDEQTVLRRLAVFVGTFTGEAAERVTAGDDLESGRVMDLLGHLTDKSLVQFEEQTGRYSLLETIRQYALDRCQAAGELEEQRSRHLEWAVEFLEARDCILCDRPVFEAIDLEYTNIRAALEWASDHDLDGAIRVASALPRYWMVAGRHRDAMDLADPVLRVAKEEDELRWAGLVSLLAFLRVGTGDPEFVRSSVVPALEIARRAGDPSAEAGCLYALAIAGVGDRAQFERVFELAALGGNERFKIWSALLGSISVLGTQTAEALVERAASLGKGFDDETFHFQLQGCIAAHAGLRGQQTEAGRLTRLALRHRIRAIGSVFIVLPGAMQIALQGDDRELAVLAAGHVWPELRHLPGSEWWWQLLDTAGGLGQADRPPSSLPVPSRILMSVLIASDLVARILLTDGRLDDAEAWAKQVPSSWPAAHASATLARAWVAVQRTDADHVALVHRALTEAAGLGLRPYAAEALELLASRWVDEGGGHDAARILGAADAARAEMGLRWRYPYHQAAVDRTSARLGELLGDEQFHAGLREGRSSSLDEAVDLAQRR